MEQVSMDGNVLELKGSFAQLGDLLNEVKELVPEGRIITQLYLDDKDVFDQALDQVLEKELGSVRTVRVVTTPLNQQILSTLNDLQSLLREVRPILRQASREMRYGAVADASGKLADCFEGLDLAVRSIEQLLPVLPTLNAGLSDAELSQFSMPQGDMLEELIREFQEKDWLSVADRIEFHLDPLMSRWQTVVNRVYATLKAPIVPQA